MFINKRNTRNTNESEIKSNTYVLRNYQLAAEQNTTREWIHSRLGRLRHNTTHGLGPTRIKNNTALYHVCSLPAGEFQPWIVTALMAPTRRNKNQHEYFLQRYTHGRAACTRILTKEPKYSPIRYIRKHSQNINERRGLGKEYTSPYP